MCWFVCVSPSLSDPPPYFVFFFCILHVALNFLPPLSKLFLENPRGNVKNVFLLTLAMPFFVTLPFCVASVAVRSCFRFYSLSLLHPENVRVFYLFCWAFLSSSRHFYSFLSFYRFISICALIFLFLFHLVSFLRGVVANCPLIDFTPQK